MSRVLGEGGPLPVINNRNLNRNTIYGNGNFVNNNNWNSNFLFYGRADEIPSAIIGNALRKHHVPGAAFEAQTESRCMPDTRVQFLSDVFAVLKSRLGPRIAWISGMAGTGKTSIALTLCQQLLEEESTCLGGSFFCSRSAGSVERTDVRCIIPTLATVLSRQFPDYASALVKILQEDPDIAHRPVRVQLEFLLKKPLASLAPLGGQIVFVIDALDECSDRSKLAELLGALSEFGNDAPVKFLLTARPEMHIRESAINDPKSCTILELHTIESSQVMKDIRLFINRSLEELAPSTSWYSTSDVDALVQLSAGLFIFAATVLKYIRDRGTVKGYQDRLRKATSAAKASHAAIAPVDSIYEFIITEASRSDSVDDDELLATRRALACILAARASLSVEALSELIGVEAEELREYLGRLHSVVYLPSDNETPGVRTLHASFGDYLLDRASDNLRIEHSLGDDLLAHGCLKVMSRCLRFNISESHSSHNPNRSTRSEMVPLFLEYACLQWIHHISSLPQPEIYDCTLAKVFRPGFLFWLEVISLLGLVRRAAAMLIFAASTVQHPELSRFFRDANIFVVSSHETIERSAPHIYLSALPFAAQDSLIYQDFFRLCAGLISVRTVNVTRHGARLVMTHTSQEGSPEVIAYSRDGHLLVSGSRHGKNGVWDMRTGEYAMPPVQGDVNSVCSVALDSHGKLIASGTESGIIYVCDILTGKEVLRPLKGHSGAALTVAFSPDGALIVSGSTDLTARLWNTSTGAASIVITGHTELIRAMAFSPDGKILASGSDDRTTRLWRVDTGELAVQPLREGHMGISSVCFAPDGTILASSSYDGVVRLWAWRAGENIVTLRGHTDSVNCIRFSPDGNYIASGSFDRSIRLWDLRNGHSAISSVVIGSHSGPITAISYSPDGLYIASASGDSTMRVWHAGDSHQTLPPLQAHTASVRSVTVSPDGTFIVSGSGDRLVRVWNMQTGFPKLPPLLGHEGEVCSVAISGDGRLIASGSADHTVRLWDAQTGSMVGAPRECLGEVNHVCFSPDTRWLASGSTDGTVSIWALTTWLPTSFSPLRSKCVFAVAFSPNGQHLAASTLATCLQLWHASDGRPVSPPLQVNMDVITGRMSELRLRTIINRLSRLQLRAVVDQLSESGTRVVVRRLPESRQAANTNQHPRRRPDTHVGAQTQLNVRHVWDTQANAVSRPPLKHMPKSSMRAAIDRLSETDLRAAMGQLSESDLRAALSRLPESNLDDILVSWQEETRSVAFSSDSRRIVSGVRNGAIYVWDLSRRTQVLALSGHSGSVDSVAWSPDGRFIASGSEDTTVRLWNAATGQTVCTWHGHTQHVRSVAFTPDSKSVLSGSADGTIRTWSVDESTSSAIGDQNDPFDALVLASRVNGWLTGPSGELLLWVPQEYQDNLILGKRCTNIISSYRVFLSAGESGLYAGHNWTKCWRGPTGLQQI